MKNHSAIDIVNRETMRMAVDEYANDTKLSVPEAAALASIADAVRDKRILDIGVGGGRTTTELLRLSRDYVGVDYVEAMVNRCRERFPGVRYEHADARSMPQFADQSFDLIVFACNGISMVDHDGRMAIFREIRRLLSRNGVFVFSTYNRDSSEHDSWFVLPDFQLSANPLRIAVRSARFFKQLALSIFNRLRYLRHEVSTAEYSIINDRCHNYRTMLYYISPENQLRQLDAMGFKSKPTIYDLSGNTVSRAARDDSLTYVVHAS